MSRFLWTQRQDMGPSPRSLHALAYDPVRQRTVLFGGEQLQRQPNQPQFLADTWQWDGQYWSQVADMGPAALGGYQLAWDAVNERIVLFGGGRSAIDPAGAARARHDTWEWDGEYWTQVDDGGPSARFGFALASDTRRKRIVLFGGAAASADQPGFVAFAETWEWDGDAWTQQEESGPPARSGHIMTFDSARGRVVLCGGTPATGSVFQDTWEWDGSRWAQTSDVGPGGRVNSALAYDGTQSVLFGGEDWSVAARPLRGDTWSWDGRYWTQRQDIGPAPRRGHAMAFDAGRNRIVVFGGSTSGDYAADTWELVTRPEPR